MCDFETYLEIARIYIGDEEATNVEWLGDNRFAVKTNCEKISVFTIQDGMIRKDIDIACDNINHCMKYVVKENILLYVSNEGLNAVELCDGLIGTRRYYVSLGKKKDIGFDIDSTSNEIIYKDCASIITIRDAHDGGLIKEIEIHESSLHDFIDELVNGSSIKRICTGEYFLWRKDRSKLEIICGNGKVRFLNPPMKADADDIILVCNRYCFIASKTKVCCISFEDDYCIRNIELSYLNSIFWCESKQMLFVLLDRGLQQICVPDLFEVDNKGIWKLKTPYLVHTYELATVLGKRRNDLLVYGNKIGETIIKNYNFSPINNGNATFDVQRGDELLLSEYVRAKFAVLRNITQERIKQRASK